MKTNQVKTNTLNKIKVINNLKNNKIQKQK